MLIKVSFDGFGEEWCILEFQGEIAGDPYNGESLGDISISGSTAKMDIGMHSLVGKVCDLTKPYVIFDDKAVDGEIRCVGIVKKKILFSTRPTQRVMR
jgi:hypothetical protein